MRDLKQAETISLAELLEYISARWYILAALMAVGGLFGLLLASIKVPIYESSATFSVTIDYTQTGALTDIQEDQAMRGVGSVIFSDVVIIKTIEEIIAKDETFSPPLFYSQAFLDRTEFRWTLRFRDQDPVMAQQVAGIWAKNAEQELTNGLIHASNIDSYTMMLDGLINCLQRAPVEISPKGICGFQDINELLDNIQHLSQNIQKEKKASLGLFNHLSVTLVEKAKIPANAVQFGRNILVMSGALIGLFIGVGVFAIRLFIRGEKP